MQLWKVKVVLMITCCKFCMKVHGEGDGEAMGEMDSGVWRDWIWKRTKRVTQVARRQTESFGE